MHTYCAAVLQHARAAPGAEASEPSSCRSEPGSGWGTHIRPADTVAVRCGHGAGANGRWCCGETGSSTLSERMWCAPPVARGFPPLDERLALLPSGYSPFLVEAMVRLGSRLPFAQVAEEMWLLFGVSVSADTVRRLTEEAGAVQVAIEQRELERIEHDAPDKPTGAPIQQVSADGAMVPLVGGGWTEVRTIAIGASPSSSRSVAGSVVGSGPRHGAGLRKRGGHRQSSEGGRLDGDDRLSGRGPRPRQRPHHRAIRRPPRSDRRPWSMASRPRSIPGRNAGRSLPPHDPLATICGAPKTNDKSDIA